MNKVLRRKQLLELIGLSNTTQWRLEKMGDFPARIKLGKTAVGWRVAEVEAWLDGRERCQGQRHQGP